MTVIENKYDDPAFVALRANQEDPLVMYLIVREVLLPQMNVGKIAAQCSHATQMIIMKIQEWDEELRMMKLQERHSDFDKAKYDKIEIFDKWCKQSYRKVVLKADDKEWQKIKEQCDCMVVIDAGLTCVPGGSETVIGLFPLLKSEVPKIIKKLQTLS